MRKSILINQPAGIGDIIFCQKIAKQLSSLLGCQIFWPVLKEISYIKDYIILPGLGDYPTPGSTPALLDLDGFSKIDTSLSTLKSKYIFTNINHSDWKDYVEFQRNKDKEEQLFKLLNPTNEDFILVNNFVGTPPGTVSYHIPFKTTKKVIYLKIMPEFTVFDWAIMMERASEIYTIDTCLNYIGEFLDLKNKRLEVYSRFNPANYMHIEGLFSQPWRYNTWDAI